MQHTAAELKFLSTALQLLLLFPTTIAAAEWNDYAAYEPELLSDEQYFLISYCFLHIKHQLHRREKSPKRYKLCSLEFTC